MARTTARIAAGLRRLERRLGIDREGRTVWVWLLPPAIGLCTAVLVPFMPGLPDAMGLPDRLLLAGFGLITMTLIASIYLISFDNDHNQQAPVDDPPARDDDGGPEVPPEPSASPPPLWLKALDAADAGDSAETAEPAPTSRPAKVPVTAGAPR
jgi:hypothetical protein